MQKQPFIEQPGDSGSSRFVDELKESFKSSHPSYSIDKTLLEISDNIPTDELSDIFTVVIGELDNASVGSSGDTSSQGTLRYNGASALSSLVRTNGFLLDDEHVRMVRETDDHLPGVGERFLKILSSSGNNREAFEFIEFADNINHVLSSLIGYGDGSTERMREFGFRLEEMHLPDNIMFELGKELDSKILLHLPKEDEVHALARKRIDARKKQTKFDLEVKQLEDTVKSEMIDRPEETMSWLIENLPENLTQNEKKWHIAKASVEYIASYLDGYSNSGDLKFLELAKQSVRESLSKGSVDNIQTSRSEIFRKPVLGFIFPSSEEFEQFLQENPSFYDDEFSVRDAWKKQLVLYRRKLMSEHYPVDTYKDKLQEAGIEKVLVDVERAGVIYLSFDQLMDDFYEFIGRERQKIDVDDSSKDDGKSKVEKELKRLAVTLSAYPSPVNDSDGYLEDIVINSNDRTTHYRIRSHSHGPDIYVTEVKPEHGTNEQPVYVLDMQGRDNFCVPGQTKLYGDNLDDFASFTDREIVHHNNSLKLRADDGREVFVFNELTVLQGLEVVPIASKEYTEERRRKAAILIDIVSEILGGEFGDGRRKQAADKFPDFTFRFAKGPLTDSAIGALKMLQ